MSFLIVGMVSGDTTPSIIRECDNFSYDKVNCIVQGNYNGQSWVEPNCTSLKIYQNGVQVLDMDFSADLAARDSKADS